MLAPWSWPCSDSETRCVISDCSVGIASPHSALGNMASMNMQAGRRQPHAGDADRPGKQAEDHGGAVAEPLDHRADR